MKQLQVWILEKEILELLRGKSTFWRENLEFWRMIRAPNVVIGDRWPDPPADPTLAYKGGNQ